MSSSIERNASTFFVEAPDVETSSEDYARRFSGKTGAWFLNVQENATMRMVSQYRGATVLDVGGGHGQLAGPLVRNGYQVTVLGSAEECKGRIQHLLDSDSCAFKLGNILNLPYSDQTFDLAISYRLISHVDHWERLLAELTRVARKAVIIDYPTKHSINAIAPHLFNLKKRLEGNTRPFTCFSEAELLEVFGDHGFVFAERFSEFLFPMVLHRSLKSVRSSSAIESIFRSLGITEHFGSPVILKAVRKEM